MREWKINGNLVNGYCSLSEGDCRRGIPMNYKDCFVYKGHRTVMEQNELRRTQNF